jgi:hypothetical protein
MSVIGLLLLGALGALLTVYLAKEEVIPEFRPLFDTTAQEAEVQERREHIKKTEQEIDEAQARLTQESVPAQLAQCLKAFIETSLPELAGERARLQVLEREAKQRQILSRSLGFLFYVVLGGVFGYLLYDRVKVEGFDEGFPSTFKAIVIGATWTAYLSTLGFRSVHKKAVDDIDALNREIAEKLEALKKDLTEKLAEQAAGGGQGDRAATPVLAGETAKMVSEQIDRAGSAMRGKLEATRRKVQKDVKGVL